MPGVFLYKNIVIFLPLLIYIILGNLGWEVFIMSVELVRDIINYEKLVGEGTGQTMVDDYIVLAERNPEFAKVLNTDGKVVIVSSEVVEDRILVEGKMVFEILYASNDENPGIYKEKAVSNFNHSIQIPGAIPEMMCRVTTGIDLINSTIVSNRKAKINAVINIKGMVYGKEAVEVITDIRGQDVQLLKEPCEIDEYVVEDNGQSVIKGKVDIPEDKGEVKSILKTNVHIHKKDVAVQEDRIIINACALIKVVYDTTGGDDILYMEQDVAFTHEMNVSGVAPGMKCDVSFKIQDDYEEIKENEEGERKGIEVEVVVDIKTKVYMKKEMERIEDAYSPEEKYELEKQTVKSMSFFGEGVDSQNLKEKIVLSDDAKPINNIKHINVNSVITDSKIVEDKVVIEGIVNCCVIYMAAVEEGGMENYIEEIPFKSTIDIPGVKFDMASEVNANIEHMSYEKMSGREIDLKVIIETVAKVFSKAVVDVVRAVEEIDISDNIRNMPSIIIYTIQQNDNLWKIAKKYYTTIEDIVKINEIQDPDYVEAGAKILIPKKMFMR
ncbi:MAG: hypothetical protein K0R09_155 [Clostridiales bacterium]|nr:hypothetical protein [Clostridiales bacterium]